MVTWEHIGIAGLIVLATVFGFYLGAYMLFKTILNIIEKR